MERVTLSEGHKEIPRQQDDQKEEEEEKDDTRKSLVEVKEKQDFLIHSIILHSIYFTENQVSFNSDAT